MIKGQIISGEFGKILIRQKAGEKIELGELLISDGNGRKIILQVYDLIYGSQISRQNLELISGLSLEEETNPEFIDENLRNYNLAYAKNLVTVKTDKAFISKDLPSFFSSVREIRKDDLEFLGKPEHSLYMGKLRSGGKVLDVDIFIDGFKALSHHILIAATTGRGKSNLTKCILYDSVSKDYCGILVLDPHDEYFGRNKKGLKDHPDKDKIVYYTANEVPSGQRTLKVNLEIIRPDHFNGVVDWSDPQKEGLYAYYKKFGQKWIEGIVMEKPLEVKFSEATLAVLKRRILQILDLEFSNDQLTSYGIFDLQAGQTIVQDICRDLENGKVVVIDTSNFSGSCEILIGSLVATEILSKYKHYKIKGQLKDKPVISIVLEEAPRVLGKDVLEKGPNIFSTIAREGRKFKIGLTAITQLPSLIPRQVLANMNTKIILGLEMQPERQAIIDSASQDLSEDSRNIASLDIGEAIVSSNFIKFATPIKIPLFEDLIEDKKEDVKQDFSEIK